MTELHRPVPLGPDHDRRRFDSGEPALDEWLRRYAGQNRRGDTAATWVIADAGGVVAAYASLSMTGIDRSAAPTALAARAPNSIPGLLLGRLAVDRSYAGLGVGTALVAHVLGVAVELNRQAACRAVIVQALNEPVRAWWERFGFTAFAPDDPTCLDMYLLTADVEETLRQLARQR